MIYALFPAVQRLDPRALGPAQQNTVFAVGKSILDRCSQVDIGALMLSHGGGGHEAAGTCQIDNDRAEAVLAELIDAIDSGDPASRIAA